MDLAQIRQKTLELLGDAAEGSSTFAPNGDYTNVDAAIQWAQEQAASELGFTFFFESALPVTAHTPPAGMPVTPGAYGGVTIPSDCIELVRVAVGVPTSASLLMPLIFVSGIGGIAVPLIPYTSSDAGVWSSPDASATFLSSSGTWALVDPVSAGGSSATVRLSVTSGTFSGNVFTSSAPGWDSTTDFAMSFSDVNPTPGETITITGQNCGYPGGTLNGGVSDFMTWSVSSNCTITDGQNTDVLTVVVNSDALPGDTINVDILYKMYVLDPSNPGGNWTVDIATNWSAPTGTAIIA